MVDGSGKGAAGKAAAALLRRRAQVLIRRRRPIAVFCPGLSRPYPTIAPNCHAAIELPSKHTVNMQHIREASRGIALAYRMIAERENETIKIERKSSLLIVAKAKVWASEGWHVVITDEGKAYAPAEFDRLLAA
jgi:hypothetical protein